MICYKKIGELHQNLHQKLFLADSLNYLRKYWSQELLTAVDLFSDSLLELHKELSFTDPEGQEIEIYIGVLQDLLMNAQPGNEYFSLNNKMHNKHLVLASRYNTVSQEHLESGLKALSGTLFTKLVINCEHLMRKLRHERTPTGVETTDIEKIGRAVGKTTMIDTYEKSVDEILANLGTFISNTLHVLIGEILNNLPVDSKWRESLVNNYELSEEAMNTL